MTNPDCDICCGSGTIRIPVRGRVTAFVADEPPTLFESARRYPCPECSDKITVEQIAAVSTHAFVRSDIHDPRFTDMVKSSLTHKIVAEMIERGFVRFERGPDDVPEMRYQMRATVGVVSLVQVAAMEQRVAQHQEVLAREVMAEASRQIDNWGSASRYVDHRIDKRDAHYSVNQALQVVLDARKDWKVA